MKMNWLLVAVAILYQVNGRHSTWLNTWFEEISNIVIHSCRFVVWFHGKKLTLEIRAVYICITDTLKAHIENHIIPDKSPYLVGRLPVFRCFSHFLPISLFLPFLQLPSPRKFLSFFSQGKLCFPTYVFSSPLALSLSFYQVLHYCWAVSPSPDKVQLYHL